jgi:hypothetical protein
VPGFGFCGPWERTRRWAVKTGRYCGDSCPQDGKKKPAEAVRCAGRVAWTGPSRCWLAAEQRKLLAAPVPESLRRLRAVDATAVSEPGSTGRTGAFPTRLT